MSHLVITHGPDDPRLYDIDDDFRRVLIDLSGLVVASASRRARFFHATSVAAKGTLQVVDTPDLPPHSFFRPGRTFRVIARYSNSQGTDDISPTVRGLSLRLLAPGGSSALAEPGLLDLTFNTGECFFVSTAEMFRRTFASAAERQQILTANPSIRSTIWSNIRTATSYPAYDFHSQIPQGFVAEDGRQWLIRFRVHPTAEPMQHGHFDHSDAWWPPDAPNEIARPSDDVRAPGALRSDLQARIVADGVTNVLQAQLHPVTEHALDASKAWPADEFPWVDLAHLWLDSLMENKDVDQIAFDPALAPSDLGIALATSPHAPASLNHARALMYRMASLARQGEPMPDELAELLQPVRQRLSRTVCVLGAGAAGLSAARELERLGHQVVVVESAPDVAGKCESIKIDGRAYDLGGHICTSRYHRVANLVTELAVPTELTTPYRVLSPSDTSFFTNGDLQRYQRIRADCFPDIGEPGLAHSARELAVPVTTWLTQHDLWSMAAAFATGYTAGGYGRVDDSNPALYFVKYAEMTGLLSDDPPPLGHIGNFTVSAGFATLWRRIAGELRDVRCGVTVRSIVRAEHGVRLDTDHGVIEADDLVITAPLDQVVPVLDASNEELRIAKRMRHNDYRTTLVHASGLPRSAFYLREQSTGLVAFHHRYHDSDVYACYSYGEISTRDIEQLGGLLDRVLLERSWSFTPHFDSSDLQDGVLNEVEELQGNRHTYYTGSLYAFELVECTVGHAQDLVRRHFPGDHTTPTRPAVPQSTNTVRTESDIRHWLITNIAAELRISSSAIDPTARLENYALESLSIATLQSELSDYLGFRVPHTLFLQAPTIDAAARQLAAPKPASVRSPSPTATPHLRALTPMRPFFCLGGMGGSASYLRPLARALGPAQPFYILELPGLFDDGEPLEDVEEIAALFVEEILQVQQHGPYRIGGHSFGGVVAYEMGRQLRARSADVGPVILIDSFVPLPGQSRLAEDVPLAMTELVTMRHMFCTAAGRCSCGVDLAKPLSTQGDAVARALGAKAPAVYEEHVLTVLGVYQAALQAFVTHTPAPSDLTVHLIASERGFDPLRDEDQRVRQYLSSVTNGWEHVELGQLNAITVGGGHFSMFGPPHLTEVATAVQVGLDAR